MNTQTTTLIGGSTRPLTGTYSISRLGGEVPLPAAMILLLSGLGTAAIARRNG